MIDLSHFVSCKDFELEASKVLDDNARNYFNSGANHELALRENYEMFNNVKINPRILRDVSNICMKTTVLGKKVSIPFGLAPTAMQKMAHPKGEFNSFEAAEKMDTIVCLSTLSTTSIDELSKSAPSSHRWMQLYIAKDREITRRLVKDAEDLGFTAFALTVDAPQLGKREADIKQKFKLPSHLSLEVFKKYVDFKVQSDSGSGLMKLFADQIDSSLNWEDVKWLQSITKLPIILKGIQSREDAELAISKGLKYLWVTNHGGRQLSDVRSTIEILPEVVEVKNKNVGVEVYVDGGIRYGADIFKCLALGADFVFLGRPMIWANAVAGSEGQVKLLDILKEELRLAMVLSGTRSIKEIDEKYVINYLRPRCKL